MTKPSRRSAAPAMVLAALAFAFAFVNLAACNKSKLNSANYAKVNNGMSQAEVEAILGPGTQQASTSIAVPAVPAIATPAPGAAVDPSAIIAAAVPAETSAKTVVWQEGQKIVTVTLVNDKVIAKTEVGL